MEQYKINIHLWSYNKEVLREAERIVLQTCIGPDYNKLGKIVPLPHNTRFWCLLKSPHVDKNAREHITATRYKRLLQFSTNLEGILSPDIFIPLILPAGVNMKIID